MGAGLTLSRVRPPRKTPGILGKTSGSCFEDRRNLAFADLLTPHGIVQTLAVHEFLMTSGLDNAATLEDINAVGVQNGGEPVCDQHCDCVAIGRNFPNCPADLFFR